MAQMKLIPADNMKDKLWGKRGTPEREAMETKLKEDVNAYIVGESIRKARLAQNLTQEQLGERIGVQRAQISKLEKGTNVITLPQCLCRLGDARAHLVIFQRAGHFRAVELHSPDAEDRQNGHRQHNDPHAAEPLQHLPVKKDSVRKRVQPHQGGRPGRRQAGK